MNPLHGPYAVFFYAIDDDFRHAQALLDLAEFTREMNLSPELLELADRLTVVALQQRIRAGKELDEYRQRHRALTQTTRSTA